MKTRASTLWFARHEVRLVWRDAKAMMTAGRPGRERKIAFGAIVFVAILHLVALATLRYAGKAALEVSLPTLIAVTAGIGLSASAMLSQAMESVTRTFYTRSDLELILSSPVDTHRLFAVRIGAIAVSISLMSLLLVGPFVDVLAWKGGLRWLGGYGVIVAVAAVTTSLGVFFTATLLHLIGPKRTRLVAQIVAAVIGGTFVIGLQLAAMFSSGTASRVAFLKSQAVVTNVPGSSSVVWWPARAALGDPWALAAVLAAALVVLLVTSVFYAPRFAGYALAAASAAQPHVAVRTIARPFRIQSASAILRRKETMLLLRDPWLISQSLMQLLYLLPPAVLLWHSYSYTGHMANLAVPVIVMAAGQLAGGLAWLTISGEDAPELVLTAPIPQNRIWRAKIEAVLECVGVVFAPFVIALLIVSPWAGLVALAGIVTSSTSAAAIQFWFRSQAKRSDFRRRHTSSRIATFSEAFVSIIWSATGAIAAAGSWLAGVAALVAIGLLATVRFFSPARARPA